MSIRIEVKNWLRQIDWDTEATLTFANDLSRQQAEQAVERFWKRVDSNLYGNAAKRFNKRCERINVLEGDGVARRWHFHILAKRPKDRFATITAFCDFLREQWLADNRNNFVVSFSPIRDKDGYLHYVTKSVSRSDCDTIVIDSSHIHAAS